MIGIWSAHAQVFLLVLCVATSACFALPLFFVPIAWARIFRWTIPAETDLAVYFGRCLGAFVLIVEALMLRAGLTGTGLEFTFQVLLAVAGMMVIVHVWGYVKRIQPFTETLEIGMYSGMGILCALFYPGLS
ncbi:MAG: hypothetical protein HY749_00615 [Gammaproteobacteria bacterium]|nr:hypothetical protein [Gammaproteobacteria bacterium]MBI5617060.1 hypothetical protein [Gammaproteobacteria bacterium]